ncbi:glycosyltransferase [[Clostridium] sordellii]|uniref:hypothetical protein n=1 Tax=Paraclostridium sordellii TaxID=1505 RepID=UPI0005E6E80C|nr:hypothetical protein [Paeniclostridium sordellii]CEQ10469.1 glycosyltransferase [[Clostridium] sordellii] [Paeniclostridium sordellii]
MKNKIKSYLKNKYNERRYKAEYMYFNELSKYLDFSKVENDLPEKIDSICFVIPGMLEHSGGHTSILRLGTNLYELGYDIRYLSYSNQSIEELKKIASANLANYKGSMHDKSEIKIIENDIVIATLWDSVYYAKKMKGYKMYFIQDYEPYFYTYGEKHLLAKKTYDLGLHMVSLGKWNKYMIESNYTVNVDYIDFPYEKSEYNYMERDFSGYKIRKEFNLAVYIKNDEKRAPFIIQSIMGYLKNDFAKKGIKLNIYYFGENKNIKLNNGENLGKLNKKELFDLYRKCDFGMVASLTNISLVPYEMIATGLPVIEFSEGTFSFFFEEGSCILTSFDYRELSNKMTKYINDDEALFNLTKKAYHQILTLSWEQSAKQFNNILENLK